MGLEELKILEKYVYHKPELHISKNSTKLNASPNQKSTIL
mgnify:CR=1 FL=1|jgi:hypothetical protein